MKNSPTKSVIKILWKDTVFSNVASGVILMIIGLLSAKNDTVKEIVHELIAPDMVSYSREIQRQAASEIESGKCPALAQFVTDYKVMRDQTRLLKGEDIPK